MLAIPRLKFPKPLLPLLLFHLFPFAAAAKAQGFATEPFDLFHCVSAAFENRADLAAEYQNILSAEQELIASLARFDARLRAGYQKSYVERGAGTLQGIVSGSKFTDELYSVEWRRELMTGGAVAVRRSQSRSESVSGFVGNEILYEEELSLEIQKPLLAGKGKRYALNGLYIQEKNLQLQTLNYLERENRLLMEVAAAYIQALRAKEQIEVNRASVEAANRLLEAAQSRMEAGQIPAVDVLEAESEARVRWAELRAAEIRFRNALGELNGAMGRRGDPPLDIVPLPDPPLENLPEPETLVDAAIETRPEIKRMDALLETAGLRLERAQSNARPNLQLTGSFGLQGESARMNFFKNMINQRWFVGLSYDRPANGFRAERAEIAQSEIQAGQIRLQTEELVTKIGLEIYNALRDIEAAKGSLEAFAAAREAVAARLEAAQARFEIGYSSVIEVIQAENRLAQMTSQENQARIDLSLLYYRLKNSLGQLTVERFPDKITATPPETAGDAP